jgi:hypothetical protein
VVVGNPLEKGPGFGEIFGFDRRSILFELGDDAPDPLEHLRPVLDGRMHLFEDALYAVVELLQHAGFRLPV